MTRTLTRRLAAVGGTLGLAVLAGIGTASADTTTATTAAPAATIMQQDSPAWNGDHGRCDDWCGRHHHHGDCDNRDEWGNRGDNGWGDECGGRWDEDNYFYGGGDEYRHEGVLVDLLRVLV